jgi:hypothetical protein
MPKSLRDIVAPRAGRIVPKGESDFLDQHKVDEKDYPVKQKTPGATHVPSTKPVVDPAKGHLGDKSHDVYKQANEETQLDEISKNLALRYRGKSLEDTSKRVSSEIKSGKKSIDSDRKEEKRSEGRKLAWNKAFNIGGKKAKVSATGKIEEDIELDEGSHCNMSEAGQMCEVHGMQKCPNSPNDPKKKLLMDKKVVHEEEMTAADKKKEKSLKKKYDKSNMKASMMQQYGKEKGKNVYFATIRKQAMEETQVSECPSNESNDEPDYEGEMAKTQLKALANKATHLVMMLQNDSQLEAWVQSKISNAKQDLDAIYDYVVFRPTKETTGPETPIAYNTVPNPSYPSDNVDVNYGSKV